MTRRHRVETHGVGAVEQAPELDRPVAFDTRVGSPPRPVLVDVRTDHSAFEVVTEVEHVMRDAELGRHPAGVFDVGDAAAAGVGLAAPELERHSGDIVAGLGQERGRH
jgi:hypothetical protein